MEINYLKHFKRIIGIYYTLIFGCVLGISFITNYSDFLSKMIGFIIFIFALFFGIKLIVKYVEKMKLDEYKLTKESSKLSYYTPYIYIAGILFSIIVSIVVMYSVLNPVEGQVDSIGIISVVLFMILPLFVLDFVLILDYKVRKMLNLFEDKTNVNNLKNDLTINNMQENLEVENKEKIYQLKERLIDKYIDKNNTSFDVSKIKKFIIDNKQIVDEILPELQKFIKNFKYAKLTVDNQLVEGILTAEKFNDIDDYRQYWNKEKKRYNPVFLDRFINQVYEESLKDDSGLDVLLVTYSNYVDDIKNKFIDTYNSDSDDYTRQLNKIVDLYTKIALVKFSMYCNVLEKVINHETMGQIIGNGLNRYGSVDVTSDKTYQIYLENAEEIFGELNESEYEFICRFYNIKYSAEMFKEKLSDYKIEVKLNTDSFEEFVKSIIDNIGSIKINILPILKTYLYENIDKYELKEFFGYLFNLDSYIKKIKVAKEKYSLLNGESEDIETLFSIEDVDLMSGYEFEEFIAELFKKMGYKTSVTKSSGDQGIDVIAEKTDVKFAIQAKCYSKPVSNHAIMEAVAGKKFYNADKVMVITNSTFTSAAKTLAKSNCVILWDRHELINKINELF